MDKYGRLHLPAEFAKALPWLEKTQEMMAWVYFVEPGRYRLLSEADAERSSAIKTAIQRRADAAHTDPTEDPFEAEGSESAAVAALVIRVKLSFTRRIGWRVHIPRRSYPVASLVGDRGFFVLFSEGYLELWTPEALTRVLPRASDEVAG